MFFNQVVKDMETKNSLAKDDNESGEDDPPHSPHEGERRWRTVPWKSQYKLSFQI